MPHAALLVVQDQERKHLHYSQRVSMPHAALLVVQAYRVSGTRYQRGVSMPHAALLVVQAQMPFVLLLSERFNAARGFVGGASPNAAPILTELAFQCRTRLCWWCKTTSWRRATSPESFQCRTRLCWWCKTLSNESSLLSSWFQCRTRLCWWCKLHVTCMITCG